MNGIVELESSLALLQRRIDVLHDDHLLTEYYISRVQGLISQAFLELEEITEENRPQTADAWGMAFFHLHERIRMLRQSFLYAPEPEKKDVGLMAHLHLAMNMIDSADQHVTLAQISHRALSREG